MAGNEIKPIAITVAPTIPVLAANKVPTMITEIPKPLFKFPNISDIDSKSFSAIFDFSKITPIKTKRGTATKVELVMIPNNLFGIVSNK